MVDRVSLFAFGLPIFGLTMSDSCFGRLYSSASFFRSILMSSEEEELWTPFRALRVYRKSLSSTIPT